MLPSVRGRACSRPRWWRTGSVPGVRAVGLRLEAAHRIQGATCGHIEQRSTHTARRGTDQGLEERFKATLNAGAEGRWPRARPTATVLASFEQAAPGCEGFGKTPAQRSCGPLCLG